MNIRFEQYEGKINCYIKSRIKGSKLKNIQIKFIHFHDAGIGKKSIFSDFTLIKIGGPNNILAIKN